MDVQGYISKRDTVGLRKLLSKDKKKKWLKQRYMNDQSALHLACDYGDPEIVSMLLKYNGDPNETDVSAQTSLHIACKQASLEVITLLISKNANVTAKSFQGNTPMHFLIGHKPTIENITDFYGVLELLKENGADLNARNGQGETPLSLACLKRSEKNAMWLIRQGADVNISNKKGERALHHAVRFGSEGLISILISAGAYVTGNNLGVESPIELANRAGRKSIAAILTDHAYLKATSQTITINGTEVTDEYLCHLKKLCITHVMEYPQPKLSPRRPSVVRRKKSNAGDCFRKYQMLVDILEMNALLLEPPEKMVWEGDIFVGNEDSDEWSEKYAVVDDDKLDISKDGEKFRQIDLSQNIRFEVYSSDISRVTIVYCLSTGDKKEHYRSKDFDFKLLKTLINNSKRPVEYIDDEPVLQTIQNLEKLNIISDGKASDSLFVPKVVRKISFGAKEFVGSPVVIPQLRNSLSKSETLAPVIEVNNSVGTVSPSGAIISTNFSSFFYAETFSPDLVMQHQKEYDTAHSYLFTSGSFSDLLNYCILHAHPSLFAGNTDVEAFYLCYYHHCELQDVIDGINNTWNTHIAVPWPKPYSNVEPASRLFAFLKGFIKSPFVLPDEEKELQFRSDLAELYGNLIANPCKPYETVSKLRDAVQKVTTAREQSSINQLCDLNSLLGGNAESSDKILLNLESDTIASQIVLINADLYKQLQLADLLDLRYQKDKKFATSLNKVHAFSNKIYLLVPTTILQSDDIEVQKVTLKKWIVIAEKLFALKDYNSTIQVINGISETSITRLDYLKRCLSAKWIERFEKVRSCFDGEGNYAKYRMLSTEAPAIPFVGVTLKDLVFTYEGNPDRIGNGINFQKYRHILQIIKTLKITNTKQYDYSFLKFDPQVARELLTVTPMTQDQLYDRSVQCSAAYTEKISSAAPGKSPHRIQRKPSLEKRPNRNLTPVMPSPEAESPTTNTVRSKRLDKYTKSSGSFASQEQKAVPTQELHLEKTSHHSPHHSPLQRTKDSYRLSRTRRQEKKSNKANLYLRSSGPELTTPTISIPAYKKSRTATNIYEDSEISQPGENEEQKIKVVVHTQKKKKFRFF